VGIDCGAVVRGLREMMERVSMIQEKFDCPALIEEFIEGREIYVGVIGNDKPAALPWWSWISRSCRRHAQDRGERGEVGQGQRGVRVGAHRGRERPR